MNSLRNHSKYLLRIRNNVITKSRSRNISRRSRNTSIRSRNISRNIIVISRKGTSIIRTRTIRMRRAIGTTKMIIKMNVV